ncbi:MAG TPA: hypothetical protein VGG25_10165, partial [Streptosporangiaceae bacterium]
HAGSGMASSFEFAVSAIASIGVHVAADGLDGQLITDSGALESGGIFRDVLLDSLAVVRSSANRDLSSGLAGLRAADGGVIVAVTGRLSAQEAKQLAVCRREQCQGIALLLAASTWAAPAAGPQAGRNGKANGNGGNGQQADGGQRGAADSAGNGTGSDQAAGTGHPVSHEETAAAAAILRAGGWRVVSIDVSTPLALAWQRLPRLADKPAPAAAAPGAGGPR